jgi:hypothetical protein
MIEKNPDIINQTIDFWTKRTGQEISPEDAREMIQNISGFFQVLSEWDKESNGGSKEYMKPESSK